MVGDRYWDRNVDSDHSYLHFVLELAGGSAVTRENRSSISERIRVDQINRLAECVDSNNTQYRSKDFVLVSLHVGVDFV